MNKAVASCASDLRKQLGLEDPYSGFNPEPFPIDLQGGDELETLTNWLAQIDARTVVEVGSWKGASAIHMAKWLRSRGANGAVVCIDTWLGSIEHYLDRLPGWNLQGHLRHGYPTLYFQFLANVIRQGCADLIVPLPNTSCIASRWLARRQVQVDAVYLDASHDEENVYQDLVHFWPLVKPGGRLMGDDWNIYWYGVVCAVNRFAKEHSRPIIVRGKKWLLEKPAT